MISPVRSRSAFAELRRSRDRVRHGPLTVTRSSCSGGVSQQGARVAYAIPRSVGTAVVRNRVRRRMRALAGELSGGGAPLLEGADYLISVRPGVEKLTFGELRRSLVAALAGLPSLLVWCWLTLSWRS